MATDLDKYIDRINTARKNQFITSSEAVSLRKLARERASRKGDFGARDRDILNEAFNKALNNRGTNAREQGQLPIGVTPNQPLPPPSRPPTTGNQQTRPTPPPSEPPPPQQSHADRTWPRFKDLYGNLRGSKDRNVIQKIFGGVGNPRNHKSVWDGFSDHRRLEILRAIRDGSISVPEKQNLFDLFKITKPETGTDTGGGGKEEDTETGGGQEGTPAFQKWVSQYDNLGDKDKDFVKSLFGGQDPTNFAVWQSVSQTKRQALRRTVDSAGLDGNDINREERAYLKDIFSGKTVPYPEPPEDEGDGGAGAEEGTVSDGGGGQTQVGEEASENVENPPKDRKTITFPKGGESIKTTPPDAERIFMPNVEKRITRRIERLTLNLIDFTREFIEAGQDYKSIDYVPLQEVFDENDLLYFINNDPNNPITTSEKTKSIAAEIINGIVEELKKVLSLGSESDKYYQPRPGPNYVWYENQWKPFDGNTNNLPDTLDKWTWNTQEKIWVHDDYPLPDGLPPGEEKVETYNYAEFLELFNIEYTEDGSPVYTMDIEIEDAIIPGVIELTTQYLPVEIEDDTLDV